jgi:hypothetical protein
MAAASIILHMEEQKLQFPKYLYRNQFKLSFAIKEENTQEVEDFDLQKLKEKFKEEIGSQLSKKRNLEDEEEQRASKRKKND